MKRCAETFIEFLVASAVFGIASAGIFEFMASNTLMLARLQEKENFSYHVQYYLNAPEKNKPAEHGDVKFFEHDGILTVIRGNISMDFRITP